MKLINVTKKMDEKLNTRDMFAHEMISHLSYTRNFYMLTKNNKKVMTNKKVTLITMQNAMDLTSYEAFILNEEEALSALSELKEQEKPKLKTKKETKKKESPKAKKTPKKESVKKKSGK